MLITGSSTSGKRNALLNLIKQQNYDDPKIIDDIYLYVKYSNETKYKNLVKNHGKIVLVERKDPKAFTKYSNEMHNVYKNIEEYKPDRKCKAFIAFVEMITDIISNKILRYQIIRYLDTQ